METSNDPRNCKIRWTILTRLNLTCTFESIRRQLNIDIYVYVYVYVYACREYVTDFSEVPEPRPLHNDHLSRNRFLAVSDPEWQIHWLTEKKPKCLLRTTSQDLQPTHIEHAVSPRGSVSPGSIVLSYINKLSVFSSTWTIHTKVFTFNYDTRKQGNFLCTCNHMCEGSAFVERRGGLKRDRSVGVLLPSMHCTIGLPSRISYFSKHDSHYFVLSQNGCSLAYECYFLLGSAMLILHTWPTVSWPLL